MDPVSFDDLSYEDKRRGGVYQWRNTLNNKVYVGSSNIFTVRVSAHRHKLSHNKHPAKHFQNAWNKDGEEIFAIEIIEYVQITGDKLIDKPALLARENYWIEEKKAYDPEFGYNTRRIAESNLGTKWNEESKKNFSQIRTGAKRSEETKKRISEGIRNSPKFRKGISIGAEKRCGVPRSEATKQKLSESHKTSELAKAHRAEMAAKCRGSILTEEHRQKVSEGLRKSEKHQENLRKLHEAAIGVPRSKEAIEKQKKTMAGRVRSPEHSAAISAAKKGIKRTEKEKEALRAGHARRKARLAIERADELLLKTIRIVLAEFEDASSLGLEPDNMLA